MQSSTELRAILTELDATVEQAGAALIQAEADHRAAIRANLENTFFSAESTAELPTEGNLDRARAAYSRARTSADLARQLLAEATKREKAEAEAEARAKILSQLDGMAALASEADTAFATLVGILRRLQATETALHHDVRSAFGTPPWRAPQSLTACRPAATFLTSLVNGLSPDIRPIVAEAVADATQNITQALQS